MPQYIGGRHAVYHAIKAGRRRVHAIYLQKGVGERELEALLTEVRAAGVPIERVAKSFFSERVTLKTHQGVAAAVDTLSLLALDELIKRTDELSSRRRLLLLDGIEDPHNLGALMRSALCFGIQGVIWARRRCAQLTATAIKSSAGAVEYLNLCQVTNLSRAMEELKKAGYWIYGTVVTGGRSLSEENIPDSAVLVIGGESAGLHRLVRENSDVLLSIPCSGPVKSLNASVAGGVLMSQFCRNAPS